VRDIVCISLSVAVRELVVESFALVESFAVVESSAVLLCGTEGRIAARFYAMYDEIVRQPANWQTMRALECETCSRKFTFVSGKAETYRSLASPYELVRRLFAPW
jgi:hypothetical protein